MQPPRWFSSRGFHGVAFLAVATASLLAASSARGAGDILEPDLSASDHVPRTGPVDLLPEDIAARVNDDRTTATSWAGYDGARRAPVVTASVEARIVGRLVIMAGVGYTADMPASPSLRPQVGLRAQLLDQSRHGVDGAVALMYRQDELTTEGGFFQGTVALERQQGPVLIVANLMYGQDGEGDDRYGEARLAPMIEVLSNLRVGLDARYRHDLWSDDPKGASRTRPVSELVTAPTASFTHGSWVVMAEAGFSSVSIPATQNGVIALAGVGSCF